MNNIILYDLPQLHCQLLPLTFTRPIAELTIGITTLREKWQHLLPGQYSWHTEEHLTKKFPTQRHDNDTIIIASHIIPDESLCKAIEELPTDTRLVLPDQMTIAQRGGCDLGSATNIIIYDKEVMAITRPYDIFLLNGLAITNDFHTLTANRVSQPISNSCTVIGDRNLVFIEEGATVEGAFLNTTNGPIYIGKDAEVMEGSCLRAPVAILEQSTVNMGTKIYGATTISAHCKVGGELNNVVMLPYSNKAHDGFLGNAVIGSWCNLGAGCTASNLKNDYTEIKLWDYATRRFLRTGLQFCGLIMGDHSKAGVNTMFNTATVTGVGVNIHGTGFPRNFVASFSEGSAGTGFGDVPLNKFFAIAERVMARRNVELTEADKRMFEAIYDITEIYK